MPPTQQPKMLHLQAKSSRPRRDAVAAVREALDRTRASILDIRYYSNHSVVFELSIPTDDYPLFALHMSSADAGFSLLEPLASIGNPAEHEASEVHGTLQLLLIADDNDYVEEIPAVPG